MQFHDHTSRIYFPIHRQNHSIFLKLSTEQGLNITKPRPVIFAPLPISFYTSIVENYYDSHRPPHPRHRFPPRHRRRIPHLPCTGQRVRRAGTKRSRTLESRMHERYPEGFRQPLAFHAEGQDLRANYFYPKTFFFQTIASTTNPLGYEGNNLVWQ